ncbi:MAG: BREX-6 system BrxE protein [Nannocystaceae bacterium]
MPTPTQLDAILTIQLAVAWAGESGDDQPRLRWWQTDMVSTYGGLALLGQLAPRTKPWAALQAALEAARRVEQRARDRDAEPDRLVSLLALGPTIDERLIDRLLEHKRREASPEQALPGLGEFLVGWSRAGFEAWVANGDAPKVVADPAGRRLTGAPPDDPVTTAQRLAHALLPLPDAYPFPHYRNG